MNILIQPPQCLRARSSGRCIGDLFDRDGQKPIGRVIFWDRQLFEFCFFEREVQSIPTNTVLRFDDHGVRGRQLPVYRLDWSQPDLGEKAVGRLDLNNSRHDLTLFESPKNQYALICYYSDGCEVRSLFSFGLGRSGSSGTVIVSSLE